MEVLEWGDEPGGGDRVVRCGVAILSLLWREGGEDLISGMVVGRKSEAARLQHDWFQRCGTIWGQLFFQW